MKKKTLVMAVALMAICGFSGCGQAKEESAGSLGAADDVYTYVSDAKESDDSYTEDVSADEQVDEELTKDPDEYTGSDDNVYYQIDESTRKSLFTDASEYEPGNLSGASYDADADADYVQNEAENEDTEEMSACVAELIREVFGMTYAGIDGLERYSTDTVYTMDAIPSLYGIESPNSRNGIFVMQKEGTGMFYPDDVCVGAYGWFSRVMEFNHDWLCNVYVFADVLRDTYPDCTGVKYADPSIIPIAPSDIEQDLAYVDFTVPFPITGDTTVRLYMEVTGDECYLFNDNWTFLCTPDMF